MIFQEVGPNENLDVSRFSSAPFGLWEAGILLSEISPPMAGIGYDRPDPRKQRMQSAKQQSARMPIGCVCRFDTVVRTH